MPTLCLCCSSFWYDVLKQVFFSVFILLCDGGDIREIMLNFLDLGLLNGHYAFITVHLPKR